MAFNKKQTKKTENISEWYNQTILNADLAEYGPAKGTMIIKPYGYALWENIQKHMDPKIKQAGVENAYFPLFIPETLLTKEKNHIDGFSPELAVVTHGGGEELQEKLIIRPTSETIMYDAYSRWIQSWRDLPILINQWNNVVRWEKRTYLFMRTTEFLWQEGHTAHATHDDAIQFQKWAMQMYAETYQNLMAIPGIIGYKSDTERFPGAVSTLTYETLAPGGKALQSCTSHDLGQNFSKPFDIKFQDKQGQTQYAWQTSWGLSTRSIGGLILTHGDDKGLILPPNIAPIQVIILPVKLDEPTITYCQKILENLKKLDIRAKIDQTEEKSIGYKTNEWELKGVPVRLEIGQREINDNTVTIAKRDTTEKTTISTQQLQNDISKILSTIQQNLYQLAEQNQKQNTHTTDNYQEFKNIMSTTKGFIKAHWCENPECEAKIKEETTATTRCLPIDAENEVGKCIYCGADSKHRWIFAQSY